MHNILLTPAFLGNLRGWEWLIIFLVILLLFGGRKIPELMRGLGKGIHSFKQGVKEAQDEISRPLEDTSDKKTSPASDRSQQASKDDEYRGKDRS
ncbi:MAG: twin-arginine translocase TatA/TatE family subunit [Muribaculaceae bacterium]|nr:twin-arginine translocase TatA/TatE family subunit [Muribaculaceae bacterium]